MMDNIPDDIRAVAFKIANGWSRNEEEGADMEADIARALMAERERCAEAATQLSHIYKAHLTAVAIREPQKLKAILEAYDPFGNVKPKLETSASSAGSRQTSP